MKAVTAFKYGGPEVLKIVDLPIPEPGPGQILVRMRASTVTSTDPLGRSGRPAIFRLFGGLFAPKRRVHGEILAGDVTAVGPGVDRFAVGDRVYGSAGAGMGAHAEYVCLAEDEALAKIPEGLDYGQAAALVDGFLTSLPFLRDAGGFRSGMRVLVNGASGAVGSMAVMLAKALGGSAVGVCSTTNLELVKALGADYVLDYTAVDFTDPANHPEKFDIVFDAAAKTRFRACRPVLKDRGIYLTPGLEFGVIFGGRSNTERGQRSAFMATGLRKSKDKARDLEYLNELVAGGKIQPVIDRTYGLDDIAAAHEYVETGRKRGNVLLTVSA